MWFLQISYAQLVYMSTVCQSVNMSHIHHVQVMAEIKIQYIEKIVRYIPLHNITL